jgi:hypothetical protein
MGNETVAGPGRGAPTQARKGPAVLGQYRPNRFFESNPVYGRRSSAASRTRTSPGMSDGARQLSALQPLGKRTLSDYATPDLPSPSPYKTARGSDPFRDRDDVDDQSSHASVCGPIDGLREEARLPTACSPAPALPLRLSPKTLLGLASRKDTLALAPTLAPALAHARARAHAGTCLLTPRWLTPSPESPVNVARWRVSMHILPAIRTALRRGPDDSRAAQDLPRHHRT